LHRFSCPFLNADVELTEERELHIAERHPDLLPTHRDRIAETLSDPDQVRRSIRFESARLISKWYTDLYGGKYVGIRSPWPVARERLRGPLSGGTQAHGRAPLARAAVWV